MVRPLALDDLAGGFETKDSMLSSAEEKHTRSTKMESVPRAVATGSQLMPRSRLQELDPVATAADTDLITIKTLPLHTKPFDT